MSQDKKPSSAPSPGQLADLLGIGREEATDPAAQCSPSDLTRLLRDPGNEAAPSADEPPQVDGYDVHSQLGAGGMGTVWRATQLGTRRQVALKLLSMAPSAAARMRFTREVELAATLDHPNIARVYDSGLHRGNYYFAMELIDGVPLDQYVRDHSLVPADILRLLRKVCDAVQHAHERGIIHRDLKPANILVDSQGQPHVLDFGLARSNLEQHDATLTRDGAVAGTIAYMAPEQAVGEIRRIGTFSDVYSLGVMLYELLVEQPPHSRQGSAYEMLRRIAEQEVLRPRAANPRIPRELEALLLKALAHEPRDRYATAGELGRDIDNYLNSEPLAARPHTTIYFLARRIRKHRWAVTTAALVALVLVGVIVSAWVRVSDERRAALRSADLESQAKHEARWQRDQAEAARKLSQTRLVHGLVNNGWRRFSEGDSSRGLLEHVEALRLVEEDVAAGREETSAILPHRQRVASLLGELPPLELILDHGTPVRFIAFSTDGNTVITVGDAVAAWNSSTGAKLYELRHTKPIRCAAISPDGSLIATGGDDGQARLWDARSGREVGEPMPHAGAVRRLRFSADSRLLATTTHDTARAWSVPEGRPAGPDMRHPSAIAHLSFNPDSARLVTIVPGEAARTWDVTTGQATSSVPIRVVKDGVSLYSQYLEPLATNYADRSADGRCMLVPASPVTARMISLAPATQRDRLLSHTEAVWTAALSPDGRLALTSTFDHKLWLWELHGKGENSPDVKLLREFAPPRGVLRYRGQFSPDSRTIALIADDRCVNLWDLANARWLLPWLHQTGVISAVAISPDGTRLGVAGDDGLVRLWPTRCPPPARIVLAGADHSQLSPDGRRIVTRGFNTTCRIHATDTGQALTALPIRGEAVATAFSPDGKLLLTASADKTLCLWNVATGKPESPPVATDDAVDQIAWAPDGHRFATSFANAPDVTVWDAGRHQQLARLRHGSMIRFVAFSPDGQVLAVAGDPEIHGISVFDVRKLSNSGRTPPARLLGTGEQFFCCFAVFRPGTSQLVAGSKTRWHLWDAATGEQIFSHKSTKDLSCAAFSPDGRVLAVGGYDSAVQLWDIDQRKLLCPPIVHAAPVRTVAFSRDGAILATGCSNGDTRLWDARTGQPVSAPMGHGHPINEIGFTPNGIAVTVQLESAELWQLLPEQRPAASLLMLAEVLSAHRLDPVAGQVLLSAEEFRARWNQLMLEKKR